MPAYLPHENALYYGAAGPGVVTVDADEKMHLLAQLTPALGGLGASMTAAGAGELIYSTAAATYGHLAAGTAGMSLLCGGAASPTWGTLGLTYGGTNANLSAAAAGGMIYGTGSALAATAALTGIVQANTASAPTAITGTANYLPKWSAAAPYLTATSLIYDSGTAVGIGSVSPGVFCELFSNANTLVAIGLNNPNAGTLAREAVIFGEDLIYQNGFFQYMNSGWVPGVGQESMRANGVQIFANTSASGGIDVCAKHASAFITFTLGGIAAVNEKARLTAAGYFGLATTAPLTRLDVRSPAASPGATGAASGGIFTIYASDTTESLVFGALDVAPYSSWIQTHDPASGYYPLAINPLGGSVGIGTTAPGKATEINHATGGCLRLTYNDANGSPAYYSDFDVSASGDLTITPSGNNVSLAAADLDLASDKALYLGAPATDGTWRIIRSGTNLLMERRETGVYVTKQTIAA